MADRPDEGWVSLGLHEMAMTKPERVERARGLRRQETEAEIRLWEALRARRLAGLKFVRQLAIGPYIADFVCREKKLIVEADGATHSSEVELAHDARRTGFLEGEGYRVLRVQNEDVFRNIEGVCETILHAAGRY